MKRGVNRLVITLLCLFVVFNIFNFFLIMNLPLNPKVTGLGSFSGVISLFIEEWRSIILDSPENTTYNFDPGDPYTLNLNVSSNFEADSWWFTLTDLKHSEVINDSALFTPNTTINAVRWSNELVISVNRSGGNFTYNNSVLFFVNVSNSAPIIGEVNSSILVCEGGFLSYLFNVTDVDEELPIHSMTPTTPFFIIYSTNLSRTAYRFEIYSGTLDKDDIGESNRGSKLYEENVSFTDGEYADSAVINITVIEINNAPGIENIGVQTVWAAGDNTSFYHQVKVNDTEDGNQDSGNLTFNISFTDTNLFDITNNGTMNFTANTSYIGVHNVTVCISDLGLINPHENISLCNQDGGNQSSCREFSLTVTEENRAPQIISYGPTNRSLVVSEGESITFNMSEYDPDGTIPDAYWYVDDIFEEYDRGSLVDQFVYAFNYTSAGVHNITGKITDGMLNESFDYIVWNVTVLDAEPPPEGEPGSPGGGGGGGIITPRCDEKWGCDNWQQCENTEKGFEEGNISRALRLKIMKNCTALNYSIEFCGYQPRVCKELNNCSSKAYMPSIVKECYYTEFPDCSDGIQNCHNGSCEVLADCGGPCKPCSTCSDRIQNQGEKEIDCGGPCPPCAAEFPFAPSKKLWYIFIVVFVLAIIIVFFLMKKYYRFYQELKRVLVRRSAARNQLDQKDQKV